MSDNGKEQVQLVDIRLPQATEDPLAPMMTEMRAAIRGVRSLEHLEQVEQFVREWKADLKKQLSKDAAVRFTKGDRVWWLDEEGRRQEGVLKSKNGSSVRVAFLARDGSPDTCSIDPVRLTRMGDPK